MPNNNDFIAKAKSQGYTDEQIRQYQILKQSGQLPVKMPVVNNTISQVDTDAALHSQGILQDFVGSGWNAAVDMVKSVPMIAKAVNDTTAENRIDKRIFRPHRRYDYRIDRNAFSSLCQLLDAYLLEAVRNRR